MSELPVILTLSDAEKIEIRTLILSTLLNYDDIMRVKSGNIQSGNYVVGSQGWKIDSTGNSEFNSGVYRGTLKAAIIENANGDIVIDATGLNSSVNFKESQITGGPSSTTSNSYVDVTGGTMNSFTLSRPTAVIIFCFLRGWNTYWFDNNDHYTNSHKGIWRVYDNIDGELESQSITGMPYVTYAGDGTIDSVFLADEIISQTISILLSAGTHTLKLQHLSVDGSSTTTINGFILGYTILGI